MSNSAVKRFGWLLLVWALIGCRAAPPLVKIGLVAPFEGANRPIGYDVIYSARLAVREINQAGGIDGVMVALVALDDSSEPDLAAQAAASLVIDPAVVAVIGHWGQQTTMAAAPIYQQAGLPLLAGGVAPLGQVAATQLPASFHSRYNAITPFEETAGDYAGSSYDAMQLLFTAMGHAAQNGSINRASLNAALQNLQIEGITGNITQPVLLSTP